MPDQYIRGVADSTERATLWPLNNPKAVPFVYNRNTDSFEMYDPDLAAWFTVPIDRVLNQTKPIYTANQIATATLNAADQTLVAAPGAGYQLRLVDFRMTAIGGNAATATSVRLKGTQATSLVNLVTVAVAALTRSTAVEPGSANVTLLADGAWRGLLDANTALVADVDNDNLATATAVLFETWHLVIPS